MKTADVIALLAVAAVGVGAAFYLSSRNQQPAVTPLPPPVTSPAPPVQYTDGNSTGAVLGGIGAILAGGADLLKQFGFGSSAGDSSASL